MTSLSTTFYFIFCTVLNSTFAISVRLSGSSSTTKYFAYGRVEINYNGTWGTVCDRLWDDDEATVVCKMLGYQYGIAIKNAKYGKGTGPVILDRAYCKSFHKSLDECSSLSFATNCSHNQDAGVACNIRLAGKALIRTSAAYGRVEVNYNGSWGTVCDDNWDSNEARVVCTMFGYSGGVALTESLFGAGNGPVWLGNVSCSSSAKDLSQCNHIGWGNVTMMFSQRYNNSSWYCNHYNDNAGVICYDLETYINKTESVCPANMACWILFGTVLLILFTLTTVIAKQFKRRKAASSSVSMTTDDMTPERNTNDNRAYTVTPNEGAMDEKERQMLVRLKEIEASKVKLMQRISIYRRNKMLDKRLDKVEMDMAILKNEAISLQGRINL